MSHTSEVVATGALAASKRLRRVLFYASLALIVGPIVVVTALLADGDKCAPGQPCAAGALALPLVLGAAGLCWCAYARVLAWLARTVIDDAREDFFN